MSAATPQNSPRAAAPRPAHQPSPFTPVDPMRLLKQYRNLLIIVAVVTVVLGIALTYTLAQIAPRYDATVTFSIRDGNTNVGLTLNNNGGGDDKGLSTLIRTQAFKLQQDEVYDAVLHKADVQRSNWYQSHNVKNAAGQVTFDVDGAMSDLRKHVAADQVKGASLMNMTFGARTPADAATIANVIADVFLERNASQSSTDSQKLLEGYSSDRNKLQQDATELERRLKTIIDESQISATEGRQVEISQRNQKLILDVQVAQTNLAAYRNLQETLVKAQRENTFQYTAEELQAADDNPFIRSRDERILGLNEERRVLIERVGPNHRAIKDLDNRIQATQVEKQQKRDEILRQVQDVRLSQASNQVNAAEANFNQLATQLEEVRKQLRELNTKMTEYASLKEEVARKKQSIQKRDEEISAIKLIMIRPDFVRIAKESSADTPQGRAFPRYEVIVPALMFVSLAMVVGFLFVREMLDQRLKGPACCKLLPHTDVLGVIPDAAEDRSAKGLIDLVVARHPHGLLAEAFRQSRSEILDRMQRRGYRTLMLVGAQGGSGVTAVAANLAATAAYNNRRVILIDANFRRPSLHRVFGLPAEQPGLADLLGGHADLDHTIQRTPVPGLDVLTIGNVRSGTIEQLESAALRSALTEMESRYDLIMIDAPPMSIVGDSRQLANRADAVVLVARAMLDKRGLISRLLNQLHGVTAECLGIVLNGVRASRGGYFSKNYRAFYDYHSGAATPTPTPAPTQAPTRTTTAADSAASRIVGSPAHKLASSEKP